VKKGLAMKERITSWLAPSTEDPDLARQQRLLNLVLLGLAGPGLLFGLAMAVLWALGRTPITGALAGLGVQPFYMLAHRLGRRGRVRLAAYVPVIVLFLTMVGASYQLGIGHAALIGYAMATLTAGILIGTGAALLFSLLSMAAHLLVGMGQTAGRLPGALAPEATVIADGIGLGLGLVVVVIFNWLSGREMGRMLRRERELGAELRAHREALEQRVTERTADLEHRAIQSQAAAEVARDATAVRDVEELMRTTVRRISERFGFYHAGIFLVDESFEYAALRAASSEGGQRMLARGHRLKIGEVGIVGHVAQSGQHRIALDVGQDAVFFDNPDLPHTRSEIALSLKVRDRVIGVLDVQSTEEAAFSEEDVKVLQTMADQVALAIENARLLEESQRTLRELQTAYGEHVRSTWEGTDTPPAFEYDRVEVTRAAPGAHPGVEQAMSTGQVVSLTEREDGHSALAAPLRLRDQVIGAIALEEMDEDRSWTENEIELVEAVSEQVALALENARLFEEARRRLQEQTMLFTVSQRFSGAPLQPNEIAETIVREFVEVMGVRECSLSVIGADEDTLHILADLYVDEEKGGIRQERERRVYRLSDYPATARAIETVQPLVVQANDPDADPAELAYMQEHGVKTLAIIPLAVKRQAIGIVELEVWDREHHYTQEQINLAVTLANQAAVALENARLFEETRTHVEELAVLNELGQALTTRLDVEEVLEEAYRGASRLLDTTNFYVAFYDPETDGISFPLAIEDGQRTQWRPRHMGQGLTEHIVRNREPVLIQESLSERLEEMGIELIGRTALSWLGVPLTVGDRMLGVMAVQSHTTPRAYDDHDRDLLTAIASQAAIALQNAHLFEETQRRATQLAAAAEVARDATAILDMDQLLDETVDLISAQFGFYHAGVFLVDDTREHAVLRAASSEGGQRMLERGHKLAVGKAGIVGHVAATGEPRIALDVGQDAFHLAVPDLPDTGSEMALPLISRGHVIGVLDVQSTEGAAFTQEDVTTLQTMADQLATAIENARLFEEIQRTAERLRELDRLKSQFLANMSHELRTPLNSIIGFSRVILKGIDGPLTEVQRTDLQAIYDSGQHLLSLINNVLDLSKIEAGRMEIIFEDMDLREIIEGVMSTAVALVKGKPVELQQSIAPDLPTVRGDPRRIRQVLVNLVGNAAKFTEEGFIHVRAEASPTEVTIAVADSGTGIQPDKLGTIFEPFMQVDASTTRRAGGTGLGLSITRYFVEMHGGRIRVESRPGEGSTFYVMLPVEPPPLVQETDEESGPAQSALRLDSDQRLVLCVDDDEGVITLFRRYLSRQGYRVIGLTDSTAAVEKARQLKPFAITLDVMMPKQDGWQVIQELKADPNTRHIPVIMCTIMSEKEQGLSLGASDYLIKPILEEHLVAALERLHHEEGQRRVLLVGEQPEDRNLLRRMIESKDGYEVVETSGDREAITLVRQVQPHVIILDLVAQDDGFDFLEAVKADESTRSIPIVVVAARDLRQEERNTLNRRVEALLQKGLFGQQELLADVAAALERIKGG
jgi:GAF domain-containing protein/DNA-binding response OmpR family regulator